MYGVEFINIVTFSKYLLYGSSYYVYGYILATWKNYITTYKNFNPLLNKNNSSFVDHSRNHWTKNYYKKIKQKRERSVHMTQLRF